MTSIYSAIVICGTTSRILFSRLIIMYVSFTYVITNTKLYDLICYYYNAYPACVYSSGLHFVKKAAAPILLPMSYHNRY